MASEIEFMDDSDDDMISCHVCLFKYNTVDRKPKFLDCHHYFCRSCIKGLFKVDSLMCPSCRRVTDMTNRELEDLATNNTVLRLVSITKDRARELLERKENSQVNKKSTGEAPGNKPSSTKTLSKRWCTVCSDWGTITCLVNEHVLRDHAELLNKNIEGRVDECVQMWNNAIENRQKIHRFYDSVLDSMRILQNAVMAHIESNDGSIAMMESRKQVARDLPNIARCSENSSDIEKNVRAMQSALEKLDGWHADANTCQKTSHQLLQNLLTLETHSVNVSLLTSDSNSPPSRQIDILQKLPLSFNGADQTDSMLKACISTLTFVVSRLAEEQLKHVGKDSPVGKKQVETSPQTDRTSGMVKEPLAEVHNHTSYVDDGSDAHNKATAPTTKGSFRDSLLRSETLTAVKSSDEWQTVAKTPAKINKNPPGGRNGVASRKCYFLISINGAASGKIVFQLESQQAPLMSAKFVEMCTSSTGYIKSRILKAIAGEAVMVKSRLCNASNLKEGVFTADASTVVEKCGSVRFNLMQTNRGLAEVSTDIQIVLVNRPSFHRCTTVFAQVVEGLKLLKKISGMNLKQDSVVVSECGIC